jgi:hypothetical protein
MQIKLPGIHCQSPVRIQRPAFLRLVAIEFHSILIRIIEVNRFAHAVIGRTLQWYLRCQHLPQRRCQSRAIRINNRRMVKPGPQSAANLPGFPKYSRRCGDGIRPPIKIPPRRHNAASPPGPTPPHRKLPPSASRQLSSAHVRFAPADQPHKPAVVSGPFFAVTAPPPSCTITGSPTISSLPYRSQSCFRTPSKAELFLSFSGKCFS